MWLVFTWVLSAYYFIGFFSPPPFHPAPMHLLGKTSPLLFKLYHSRSSKMLPYNWQCLSL